MNKNIDNKKDTANKKATWTLALGHFSIDSYSAFINPIMPFIALKLGITLTLATTLISISHLCSSIIQPLFGYSADILKKRFFIGPIPCAKIITFFLYFNAVKIIHR